MAVSELCSRGGALGVVTDVGPCVPLLSLTLSAHNMLHWPLVVTLWCGALW